MPESYWSSDVLGRQRGTWPRTWQASLPSSHLLFCSCISLSHFLCLFIVVRKKRIFSIFSLSSTSAKPSVYVPAHTHTHTDKEHFLSGQSFLCRGRGPQLSPVWLGVHFWWWPFYPDAWGLWDVHACRLVWRFPGWFEVSHEVFLRLGIRG